MMEFPDGLRRTLALFSRAAYDIFNSDEIEVVIKSSGRKERKYIEILKEATNGGSPEYFIIWAMIPALKFCPTLMLDIITNMVMLDDMSFTEDELKKLFEVKQ